MDRLNWPYLKEKSLFRELSIVLLEITTSLKDSDNKMEKEIKHRTKIKVHSDPLLFAFRYLQIL